MSNNIHIKHDHRDFSLDLLKSLAIIGVVIIHICSYKEPILSFDWMSNVFWGSLVRGSVPVFLMCSGAMLLSPSYPFSLKRFFGKNVLRILTAMLFWAFAYQFFHLIKEGSFSVAAILQCLKDILFGHQEFHLYYLQIILLVYLFLPVTRIITEHANKSMLYYLLAVWFLLGIVYPTVAPFAPFSQLGGIPLQYKMNMTYAAIGYTVLGYTLKRYPLPKSWYGFFAAIGFCIVFIGTVVFSVRHNAFYTGWLEGMSIGPCLLAAGIYGICHSLPIPGKSVCNFVTKLSKASFCIYLVHMFSVYILRHFGLPGSIFPALIGVPFFAGIVILTVIPVYTIFLHCPIINKWLI